MRRRAPAAIVLALVLLAPIVAACRAKSEPAPAAHTDYFTKCAGCHLADYQSARDHVGKRPTMCPVCHSQEDWHPLEVLDHPWQLTGAHEGKDCFKCHTATPPVFAGTSKECVGCHRKEYDGAPYHAKLPTNCQKCHETSAWKPALWIDEAAWEPEPEPAASQAPAPPASSSAAPVASHPPVTISKSQNKQRRNKLLDTHLCCWTFPIP